ncbi:MAG TPA: TlpA disulfide reductase family protein [Thermohalobaculum sp.]|nr:TlpA disulfide reductase family protein [Thermohalobaculum sp.]
MSRSPFSLALAAILYGAIFLTANAVNAADLSAADRASLKEMRSGDMLKLVVHAKPRDRIAETFRDLYGNPITLADYSGKVVLLNIWATWCPPCRAEMPAIDQLAGAMAGKDFAVIPLSTDRGGVEKVAEFFKDIRVENLKVMHDRTNNVARQAGALGLPVTLILDREGREIARLLGAANWNSPDARAILRRVIEMTGGDGGVIRA